MDIWLWINWINQSVTPPLSHSFTTSFSRTSVYSVKLHKVDSSFSVSLNHGLCHSFNMSPIYTLTQSFSHYRITPSITHSSSLWCLSNRVLVFVFAYSDNGLDLSRHQAIIWTSVEILLISPLGTNFSETLIERRISSFNAQGIQMHSKMSSAKHFVSVSVC